MKNFILKKVQDIVYVDFPYNYSAAKLIRTIPGYRWDITKNKHIVPDLPTTYPILAEVQAILETYNRADVESPADLADLSMYHQIQCNTQDGLYPEQVECLRKLNKEGNQLIADQVGYGKTIEAISFLRDDRDERCPALFITPANLKLQWEIQIKGWMGKNTPIQRLNGQTPHALESGVSYIINYEILQYWLKELQKCKFNTIVVDECVAVCNTDTIRAKAVRTLAKKVKYRILMSATPWRSKISQLWSALNIITPATFPNFAEFKNMFCERKLITKRLRNRTISTWEEVGIKNANLLSKLIQPYVVRREKKTAPPQRVPLYLEVDTTDDRAFLAEIAAAKNVLDYDTLYISQQERSFFAKAPQIVDWVKDIIAADEKIILFVYNHSVINYLQKAFGKQCVTISGKVSNSKRAEIIDKFSKDVPILIGQRGATGVGVDGLHKICRICCFPQLPKLEADVEQCIGRLDRDGQTGQVLAYFPLGYDTFDIPAYDHLVHTGNIQDSVLGGRGEERDFVSVFKNYVKTFDTK